MKRPRAETLDWKSLLTDWSRELLETKLAQRLEPAPESPSWLGFAPATTSEIEALEKRLGVVLPPSYRAFLSISNGWRRTTAFIGRIRPTQEVDWFRVENERWAEIFSSTGSSLPDEEYYAYPEDGAPDHRAEHMSSLLQISDVEDGVYLLNPEAVTPDGEWEAWFFANWVPGAKRFPSFAHLMFHDYRSFRTIEQVKRPGLQLPRLATPSPHIPRVPAERVRKNQGTAPALEDLIQQMRSGDDKVRAKAARMFCGKLQGRQRARRRPDLVPLLTDLFYSASDADVRCACVTALTELAEDGTSPTPLFDALSDASPNVVLAGLFALAYFPDARAVEPVCRFIESGVNVLINQTAMSRLGEMGDDRAVPTLVKVLLDTQNSFDQGFGTAGLALARCGPRGFDALAAALGHADPRVRLGAVVGLDVSGDARTGPLLDQMASDPDPRVRDRARMRMGRFPGS